MPSLRYGFTATKKRPEYVYKREKVGQSHALQLDLVCVSYFNDGRIEKDCSTGQKKNNRLDKKK